MKRIYPLLIFGMAFLFLFVACNSATETANPPTLAPTRIPRPTQKPLPIPLPPARDYEIVTLFPRDVIRAIDEPTYLSASEANLQYDADELVIGVYFDGDARAYSIPLLSRHEIINTTVGGQSIAVTW
jgi:hypothetical protein